jgi:mono/diheme cytochrome c family protein/heme/copper-type cytochrome/quinol oxidase subunit 4
MAHDNHSGSHHKGGIGFYVFVLMVLAVITYIEFAIVEYEIAWLNRGWTLALLAILSLVKFFMVIWFFMHLKDDNKTYTGFFSSGMVIAMGTFIALAALFTVRSAMNVRAQNQVEEAAIHGEAEAGHGGEEHAVEIPERAFADTLRVPQPKNQGLAVELPRAATDSFSLDGIPAFGLVNDTAPANETTEDATPETIEPESSAPAEETEEASSNETSEDTTAEASSEEATSETEADVTETETAETETTASEEAASAGTTLTADASTEWDKELGEQTYTNCVACHQPNGQGVPAAFPPQAGHAPEIYNVEGGRTYMIHTVLYGLQGEIVVDGTTYNGIMTPWGALLDDEQIASVLNHVLTSWGNDALLENFTPITPEEVAAERATPMTAQEVYDSRAALGIPE